MKKGKTYYRKLFRSYPDLVTVVQFREMLGGIGDSFARKLIQENRVKHIYIKPSYFVSKASVIEYVMSKDQFRQVCHIGTRTATRLIESGLVPAIDTHTKTCRYLIAREDVERYLDERVKMPEKYGYEYRTYGAVSKYNRTSANRLKEIAATLWENEPDLLDVPAVSRLIGYRTETIYKWHIRYNIRSIYVNNKLFIPKTVLVKFIGTRVFHEIEHKSKKHYERYDYIIIDCGLKHELLTVNALAASDYCIIPVQAHFLASEGIPDVLDMVKTVQSA